tara:strand:- start:282 stop:2021 length:1740 start_codon:yes stop_codon:yes gene_type:complete
MKILKLLSNLIIFFISFFQFSNYLLANEPVDIWSIDKKDSVTEDLNNIEDSNQNIYKLDPINSIEDEIIKDIDLYESKNSLVGLYDPEVNNLSIEMWSSSNGESIKSILKRINKKKLSQDSIEVLEIALLTNSYPPKNNISESEFNNLKIEYLLKKNDLDLIKKFILNNPDFKNNTKLIEFYVNKNLSKSNLESSCSIFENINIFNNDYLSKFKIYCLIQDNKNDEAQLFYDLKTEQGFVDNFFEKKFNYLMGYTSKIDKKISEKDILNFHLSHRTNPEFKFVPNNETSRIIWDYLSSANLLEDLNTIDLENDERIKIIETATHQKNYSERELFDLYKRFQFNIDQLINAQNTYKLLPPYKGRALLYQKLLISKNSNEILDLSFRLKSSFQEDGIDKAFEETLLNFLNNIKFEDVPSNYTTFYEKNINFNKNIETKKIKINNKLIHQSKLINYFLNQQDIKKTEKDLNDFLKKTKKNKKYFVSKKDIILIESLKSDGIKISKKYENLYDLDNNIPNDLKNLIENSDTGMILLRLAEIIGEDSVQNLDIDTINFIISTLNFINMDTLRNKIILEILPLKV